MLKSSGKLRLAAAAMAAVALATVDANAGSLSLTIYNRDLALVRDGRTYDLERGVNEIRVVDVPAALVPTSVLLAGDGLAVLEQNFEYDLASADRILDRYLDEEVTVVLESGAAHFGRLVSYEARSLVLTGSDGAQVISRERVDRIDFPELPGGLTTRPTLVWALEAEKAGAQKTTMSYLTGGMGWHAEYVALVNENDDALELSAWVSLDNRSGASFENASLQLVAGDVNRATPEFQAFDGMATAAMAEKAPTAESFFEYHLYTFDRPVTIKDRQTKQVTLFPTAQVADVVKSYRYRGGPAVEVRLAFENTEAGGLGLALPEGVVRVYKADARGTTQLLGEDRIGHTPRDESVELSLGNAFDVVGERKIVASRQITPRTVTEQDIEVEIRNRKDEPVVVVVEERAWGDWEITSSTHEHRRESAGEIHFDVAVPARSEATLAFTLRVKR